MSTVDEMSTMLVSIPSYSTCPSRDLSHACLDLSHLGHRPPSFAESVTDGEYVGRGRCVGRVFAGHSGRWLGRTRTATVVVDGRTVLDDVH